MLGIMVKRQHRQFNRGKKKREKKKDKLKLFIKKKSSWRFSGLKGSAWKFGDAFVCFSSVIPDETPGI